MIMPQWQSPSVTNDAILQATEEESSEVVGRAPLSSKPGGSATFLAGSRKVSPVDAAYVQALFRLTRDDTGLAEMKVEIHVSIPCFGGFC
jgi:hypothetical protein